MLPARGKSRKWIKQFPMGTHEFGILLRETLVKYGLGQEEAAMHTTHSGTRTFLEWVALGRYPSECTTHSWLPV